MTEPVNRQPRYWEEGHLSFSGGGFIGIYHVGVAIAFKKFAPHITSRKVLGASSGALASMCLVTNMPIDQIIKGIATMSTHCRSLALGPFDPRFSIFNIMKTALTENACEDAHQISTNKLFISLTRATTLENKMMSDFESREELIDVLLASCFIPYFLGLVPPTIRGVSYIDGGFTDNLPTHDENTITVSPFAGMATIRPRPSTSKLPDIIYTPENAIRMVKTVFSPPPKALAEVCQEGFKDALEFIREHDLFACESCALLPNKPETRSCRRCLDLISEAENAGV
ncbi:patatin-like phospholipase domain-containing protein 2, partial [Galendromus occidentalis]|uniref:Patatin-like phospholipase domain-containing protein 2 n=1 Tax=Galendromus occidentalis TaxID=34638 RepID=A0AAJ7L5B1_9ACAR